VLELCIVLMLLDDCDPRNCASCPTRCRVREQRKVKVVSGRAQVPSIIYHSMNREEPIVDVESDALSMSVFVASCALEKYDSQTHPACAAFWFENVTSAPPAGVVAFHG
jgi:uncharacterized Fe-S radical SAM superfamily protein PflX